jgi:hypothetical protein
VIHDVDESLRQLVKRHALTGSDVDVVFEAPTKDWSSRRNTPTVNLYLYDIREDMARRAVGRPEQRDERGLVVARSAPPRWFKLSYLMTAWTQRPEDEHRLLSILLGAFLRTDKLPNDVLAGSLAEQSFSIPCTCALPPTQDRSISDVWSALGGELKPSLDVVVTAPFDLSRPIEVGPPVTSTPGLRTSASSLNVSDERAPKPVTRRDDEPDELAEGVLATSGRSARRSK